MTGVLIAGGAGTRLRPLTYLRPKPMVPLANKPLIQYQIELLRKHDIHDIVLAVSGDVGAIEEHFGEGRKLGVRIYYSVEPRPLGTGGAVRFAEQYFRHDNVLAMNGDNLIDFDLSRMVSVHMRTQADVTIGLVEVPKPTSCGIITTGEEDRIIAFEEPAEQVKKAPGAGAAEEGGFATVNSGVYVISVGALGRIPLGAHCSIEREFFPSVIRAGGRVYGCRLKGYWIDVGSPENYLRAHRDLLSGQVDADIAGDKTPSGYWKIGDATVDPSARIEIGVHLGDGVRVGRDAEVSGYSAVGPGSVIGEGSTVHGCVLLENVVAGVGCTLSGCIIDREARIGDATGLLDGSIVAGGSSILGR